MITIAYFSLAETLKIFVGQNKVSQSQLNTQKKILGKYNFNLQSSKMWDQMISTYLIQNKYTFKQQKNKKNLFFLPKTSFSSFIQRNHKKPNFFNVVIQTQTNKQQDLNEDEQQEQQQLHTSNQEYIKFQQQQQQTPSNYINQENKQKENENIQDSQNEQNSIEKQYYKNGFEKKYLSKEQKESLVKQGLEGLEMIFEKTLQLQEDNDFKQWYQEKKKDHSLQMYSKRISNNEGHSIDILHNKWKVPCTAKQFIGYHADIEAQLKADKRTHEQFILEEINSNNSDLKVKIMYMSYKKFLTMSPRDFIYLKSYGKFRKNDKEYWIDCSQKISPDIFDLPQRENFVRGEIVISGHTAFDDENIKNESHVRSYTHTDCKVYIPFLLAKPAIIQGLKSYNENCIKEILSYNFSQTEFT